MDMDASATSSSGHVQTDEKSAYPDVDAEAPVSRASVDAPYCRLTRPESQPEPEIGARFLNYGTVPSAGSPKEQPVDLQTVVHERMDVKKAAEEDEDVDDFMGFG